QPAPAPMPMVGMPTAAVTFRASSTGTHSTTSANAPASSIARASSSSRASSRCTLNPPKRRTDCGVSPTCPITGMSAPTPAPPAAAPPPPLPPAPPLLARGGPPPLEEPPGPLRGLLRPPLECHERRARHQQRPPYPPRHQPGVVDDLVQCHRQAVALPLHHHA